MIFFDDIYLDDIFRKMQEDLDLVLESPQARAAPFRGRRSIPQSPGGGFGSPSTGNYFGSEGVGIPQAPPRSRKTGGWASTDIQSSGFSKLKHTSLFKKESKPDKTFDDDFDSDLPVIPDLEEVKDEDFAAEVAEAPSVAVNRVATLQELDNDLLKHNVFSSLDGIDLRLLTKSLAPESAIQEEDTPWTWDVLFTQVSSELTDELEDKDENVESPIPVI